jgi:hypothetical protein
MAMAKQQPATRERYRSKRNKEQMADPGTGQSGHEEEVARYEQELAGYLQERIKPGLNSGAIPLLARSIAKAIAHREHPNGASQHAEVEDEHSAEVDDDAEAELDDDPEAELDDDPEVEQDDEAGAELDEDPEAELDDDPEAELDDDPEAELDDDPDAELDDDPDAELDDDPDAEQYDDPDAEQDDDPDAEQDDDPDADDEAPRDFEGDLHEFQAELGEEWIVSFSVHGDDAWLTAEKDDGSQRLEAQTAPVLREAVELLNEGGGRSSYFPRING